MNDTIRNNWSMSQTQPNPLLTPEDLHSHLRLFPTGSPPAHPDDDYITALIAASTQAAEDYMQRALMPRTVTLKRERFARRLYLPVYPVLSVDSITYTDPDGDSQTLTDFTFTDAQPAYIDIESPPHVFDKGRPVTIMVTAGYAVEDSPPRPVPEIFKSAVKLMVGNLYENRETVVVGTITSQLPQSFEYLLHPHRVMGV